MIVELIIVAIPLAVGFAIGRATAPRRTRLVRVERLR